MSFYTSSRALDEIETSRVKETTRSFGLSKILTGSTSRTVETGFQDQVDHALGRSRRRGRAVLTKPVDHGRRGPDPRPSPECPELGDHALPQVRRYPPRRERQRRRVLGSRGHLAAPPADRLPRWPGGLWTPSRARRVARQRLQSELGVAGAGDSRTRTPPIRDSSPRSSRQNSGSTARTRVSTST